MTNLTRRSMLALSCAGISTLRARPAISSADDRFLEDLQRRSFQFFWDFSDPNTGLTRDRARSDGAPYDKEERRDIGSIAATGFSLAGTCIAAERGWVKPGEARTRVRNCLSFFADHAPREHGWFYHWMNV